MIITTNFQQQFNYINPQELQQKLANNSVLLIDVREKNEYQQGYIEGAILKPLSQFNASELLYYDNVVIYCRSGKRSHQAAQQLIEKGMKSVMELSGGIDAWQGANLPVVINE